MNVLEYSTSIVLFKPDREGYSPAYSEGLFNLIFPFILCEFELKSIISLNHIVYLLSIRRKNTIMNMKTRAENSNKKQGSVKVRGASKKKKTVRHSKFSPSWVVVNAKDAPGFKMELIGRIREGVKKSDWKQLIQFTNSTEKEFEHILPASISSMQKKAVYGKETSERIYELARLFGLGYEVFDSKVDFKRWLMTPSKTLGNKIPFELLDSSFGFEMVENEIIRIQFNVYS